MQKKLQVFVPKSLQEEHEDIVHCLDPETNVQMYAAFKDGVSIELFLISWSTLSFQKIGSFVF